MEQKHRFSEPEGTLEMSSLVPSVNKWQGPKKKTNKKKPSNIQCNSLYTNYSKGRALA